MGAIKIKEDKNFLYVFFDWINWFIEIPIVSNVIIPIIMAFIITAIINKRVTIAIEKLKHKNEKELQIESFYRESAGKEIVEMFNEWASIILNMETHINDKDFAENYQNLMKKTFIFGSKKTIKILTLYQQYNYNPPDKHFDKKKGFDITEHQAHIMVYLGLIAASIKKDYTNQDIDCTDLIKMKFIDYYKNEKLLDEVQNDILKKYKDA
ncbi:hypothetical protein [Mammaliicoccus sciuri]|uniref:hypothetical protein n=1 Tax=Mammaliicoccus sciuri TaxID=1296 RepID=UPI002B259DC6|nr:hypothetical protein [Mammaliicoccus sciuri]MEB8104330.1 hypothetical protein [Mammaliicoccus sciuri]WQJ70518.1 hypothetical protein P3U72_09935 [Mammaliicoccus sciuri]